MAYLLIIFIYVTIAEYTLDDIIECGLLLEQPTNYG